MNVPVRELLARCVAVVSLVWKANDATRQPPLLNLLAGSASDFAHLEQLDIEDGRVKAKDVKTQEEEVLRSCIGLGCETAFS